MENTYSIYGHGYRRKLFFFNASGKMEEYKLPGGTALLAWLMGIQHVLPRSCREEYYEIKPFEAKKEVNNKDDKVVPKYRSFERKLGIKDAKDRKNYEELIFGRDGKYTIVYDQELGVTSIPGNPAHVMWISDKALPIKKDGIDLLFIDGDVLREKGAMISKSVSWERTVMNLLWHLRNNKKFQEPCKLCDIPRILVTFAEDGAVYIINEGGKIQKAWLYLLNGRSEGNLREEKLGSKGYIGDSFIIMAAAAAKRLPEILPGSPCQESILGSILGSILESGAKFIRDGYPLPGKSDKVCKYKILDTICKSGNLHPIGILPSGNTQAPETYLIANPGSEVKSLELAKNYVLSGREYIEGQPILEIGKLKSIDRWEIEAFHNIRNVILDYYKQDQPIKEEQQPLSIAVFGSPGSGKSFGVKQIVKNVLGEKFVERKEFNVTQFVNEDDLSAAFQKVRDIILAGKFPLVVFEEFDVSERRWLKNFLMPMQDGKFKDGSGEHPLGKCILVFAGGTAATFDEFSAVPADKNELKAYKDQKVPDFVSRIKASINIAGPNPRDSGDYNYILRRALLLRDFCEDDSRIDMEHKDESGKPDFIDPNILKAMLLVPKFKHGARSVKTILEMSRIETGKWTPASLPLGEQMEIHVSDRRFTDILLINEIIASPLGEIAQKIHRQYYESMKDGPHKNRPNVKPWEELAMEFMLSNIDLARSYDEKLRLIGYRKAILGAKDNNGQELEQITKFKEFKPEEIEKDPQKAKDDQVLQMAMQEHDRWMLEKLESGWSYAPARDDDHKLHDCLVPWNELPDEIKEWDKDPVRDMIPILESQGYGIYKK